MLCMPIRTSPSVPQAVVMKDRAQASRTWCLSLFTPFLLNTWSIDSDRPESSRQLEDWQMHQIRVSYSDNCNDCSRLRHHPEYQTPNTFISLYLESRGDLRQNNATAPINTIYPYSYLGWVHPIYMVRRGKSARRVRNSVPKRPPT